MRTLIKNNKIAVKVKKQFYARALKFEDSARWVKDKKLLNLHKELIPFNSSSRVLDLCCGTGLVGKEFAGKAFAVTGIDISGKMLEKASKRLDVCVNANAEAIPFSDNYFNFIVCRQALHFLNLKKAFKEMYRTCKDGGKILVSQIVPYGRHDKAWLFKIHKLKQPLLKNYLDEEDIKRHLRSAGFTKLEKHYYYLEENIDDWLRYEPELSKQKISKIKNLFRFAPKTYKIIHGTKLSNNSIVDKMKWVIITGKKPC
ncbi:MAG: methyltransferase domain-containing protein [Elusimicrobia bacterium]|nr:methyltransferase domain-containing protein [Candidatus Liberimonas magnetica]